MRKPTNNHLSKFSGKYSAVLAPRGESIVATISMGIAVLKTISFSLAYLIEAKIMATEFSKRAVDIAVRRGTPRAKNTGIKMKAAPTPAMVKTVVKPKVAIPAMMLVNIVFLLIGTTIYQLQDYS
jgi:hypothetical protein